MKHRLVYLWVFSIVLIMGYVQQMACAFWLKTTPAEVRESRHLLADAVHWQEDALPVQHELERGRSLAEGGQVRRPGSTYISPLDNADSLREWKRLCRQWQATAFQLTFQPALHLRLCLWLI